MAEADWNEISGSLSQVEVSHGATAGVTPPDGGAVFTYGFP